jgi:hypothetical protein
LLNIPLASFEDNIAFVIPNAQAINDHFLFKKAFWHIFSLRQ